MTVFFDYQQVLDLMRRGGSVERSGIYAVWVWARTGSRVRVGLDGHTLGPTHAAEGTIDKPGQQFAWERAGEVELQKDMPFELHIDSRQNGLPKKEIANVGYLALSSVRGFDPARSFEISRVFPPDTGPVRDGRLAETKQVYTPWTLRTYATREEWEERAGQIRQQILACMGLKPRIFGRVEREGYSVEKVFFESLPGFFVCGNLYRPMGKGPFPGIACPHGHWSNGRLEDTELGSIPGRCINLARQGHVAFSYDMAGYVDSDQIDHRSFGGRREDLWGIGVMGLQLWNGIRVVDFLCSLEEVDIERIGCTGASGGGTQTFMLTAVDQRVKAAAPVNMVSAHMQGGCNCENQAHLRLDINNVEIASVAAPRPLFLVSATGDWTVDTPELEFPAIREIYRLYGAGEKVGVTQVDAPHNFNRKSREAIYAFFGRVFLGETDGRKFRERPFAVEEEEDLRVFHGRERPAGALNQEEVVEALVDRSERRLAGLRPKDAGSLRRFREEMGPALQHALSVERVERENLYVRSMGRTRREGFIVQRLILGRRQQEERFPALFFTPRGEKKRVPAVLVVHPEGKGALVDLGRGRPGLLVAELLKNGYAVLGIDPFLTGEFHSPFETAERDTGVSHFHTYNQATAACRVQDVLTAIAYLGSLDSLRGCHLMGLGRAGIWCLLARALCPEVERTVVDFDRLAVGDDRNWLEEELFIPAIRSAGDVRTALALCAPGDLLVHNTGGDFPTKWAQGAYRSAGKEKPLLLSPQRMGWRDLLSFLLGGKAVHPEKGSGA